MNGDWLSSLKADSGDDMFWDIVVEDVAVGDWENALAAIRTAAAETPDLQVVEDISDPLEPLFRDGYTDRRLVLLVGEAEVHCHFFLPDEIELNVHPRAVSHGDAPALLGLMRVLGTSTARPCMLTPGNAHDIPLLIYDPRAQSFTMPG